MTSSIEDFLSREQINSIRNPIETARTLPALAFTDAAFYQLEVDKIYQKHWVAAFFDFEVPNPGDLRPFEVCGIPLLAVRGHDSKIRVFHNICPYDGCLAVIDAAEQRDEIVTPYHGWVYDLEGNLCRIPYWDGSKDGDLAAVQDKDVNLVQIPTGLFMNVVFINLSAEPEPFEEHIAPVLRSTDEYNLNSSAAGRDENGDILVNHDFIKTNWKTHYENACLNVLHEGFVHDFYRKSPEIPRVNEIGDATFTNIIDEKFMALGYDRETFSDTYFELDAPHLGKLESSPPETETFGTLYPNFYFSASAQYIEVCLVLPHGPSKVEQKAIYHLHEEAVAQDNGAELSRMVADIFSEAAQEDGRICEAVQAARKSPVYSQKFYAPFWDSMHHRLNNMILDDLERP